MDKNQGKKPKGTILAVASTKGGSSKSTTAASLAGFLADLNKKVLIVDADIQPSLSNFFDIFEEAPNDNGITELLKSEADPFDCITRTVWDNIDLIQSNNQNSDIVLWIQSRNSNITKLKDKLEIFREKYDYIIVDSPGNYNKLTEAASISGDIILMPVVPDQISASEIKRSTIDMFNEIAFFRPNGMGRIKIMVSKKTNTNGARKFALQIKALTYDNEDLDIKTLNTEIPLLACYADSSDKKTPVHLSDKRAKKQIGELTSELFPELTNDVNKLVGGS